MSGLYGISSDSVSTLFSFGNTSSNSGGSVLATYASLKNGSFYKLTKAYYKKIEEEEKKTGSSETVDTAKELTNIKSNADSLTDSAATLIKSKETDGEGLLKDVQKFVSDYNTTISASKNANTTSLLTAASSMTKASKANEKLLKQVGITIGSDNSLKLDEETFKNADKSTLSSLFKGSGSYAYNIKGNATYLSMSASNAAQNNKMYSKSGKYTADYDYSSVINSLV